MKNIWMKKTAMIPEIKGLHKKGAKKPAIKGFFKKDVVRMEVHAKFSLKTKLTSVGSHALNLPLT